MPTQAESSISCLLLAAGSSRRMGHDKLSLPLASGASMLEQTARSIEDSPVHQKILVVRDRGRLLFSPEEFGFEVLEIGQEAEHGMHRSLKLGISALSAATEAVMVALGDQPFLRSSDYVALLKAFREGLRKGQDLLYPVKAENPIRRGNPAVIHRRYFPEILKEPDRDQGCRYLFERYPDSVQAWQTPSKAFFQDLDTPEEYRQCLN